MSKKTSGSYSDWLEQGVAEFSAYVTSGGRTRLGGRRPVIKIGGSLLKDRSQEIIQQLVILWRLGVSPVVIHGGGKHIGEALKRQGMDAPFVQGLRVTSQQALLLIIEALDAINVDLVRLAQQYGGKARGCLAKDSPLIAVPLNLKVWGYVGKIEGVNIDRLKDSVDENILFLSCLARSAGSDADKIYNVNADMAASAIARAISADTLIYLTDQDGVLDAQGNVIEKLSAKTLASLQASGVIKTGMLPKTQSMLEALRGGVKNVRIINGKRSHCILRCLCADARMGTTLLNASANQSA